MNYSALIGVHRLEHNALLVLNYLVSHTSCQSTKSLFALSAVALGVESDLNVLSLLTVNLLVSGEICKVLKGIEGVGTSFYSPNSRYNDKLQENRL